MPGIIGSVLGLVGPVSVYCDWVRWKVGSATSISVWQHVILSVQIYSWDTLACCWDIKQATNQQTTNFTQKQSQDVQQSSMYDPCSEWMKTFQKSILSTVIWKHPRITNYNQSTTVGSSVATASVWQKISTSNSAHAQLSHFWHPRQCRTKIHPHAHTGGLAVGEGQEFQNVFLLIFFGSWGCKHSKTKSCWRQLTES